MRTPLLLAALALAACGTLQNGAESILKPSMVSPQFKDLDAPKRNPFAQARSRVQVLKVGIRNYDTFFQDSSEVKGTVVLADVVLNESDTFIANTKKSVKQKRELSPAQQAAVKKEQQRVAALQQLLTGLPARSGKLIGDGNGLSKNAARTFVGPNALKLPGVVKGLEQSLADLRSATQKAPGLLSHAERTSAALTTLR